MNKYLNYYKEDNRYDWEKPPIGLIICEHKGWVRCVRKSTPSAEEVRYALGDLEEKIFVAQNNHDWQSYLAIRTAKPGPLEKKEVTSYESS